MRRSRHDMLPARHQGMFRSETIGKAVVLALLVLVGVAPARGAIFEEQTAAIFEDRSASRGAGEKEPREQEEFRSGWLAGASYASPVGGSKSAISGMNCLGGEIGYLKAFDRGGLEVIISYIGGATNAGPFFFQDISASFTRGDINYLARPGGAPLLIGGGVGIANLTQEYAFFGRRVSNSSTHFTYRAKLVFGVRPRSWYASVAYEGLSEPDDGGIAPDPLVVCSVGYRF